MHRLEILRDCLPHVVRLSALTLVALLGWFAMEGVRQWRTATVSLASLRLEEARLRHRYEDSVRPALEIRRDSIRAWRKANPYPGHPDTHRGRK